VRIIEHNGLRLAVHLTKSDRQQGLNFYSDDGDFVQVGIWGYQKGKSLQAHIHNEVRRDSDRTQEVIYVIQGSAKSTIYTEDEQLLEEVTLEAGDVLILLRGGHGYEILDNDTYILEVKNGPYPGAEVDRRRLRSA